MDDRKVPATGALPSKDALSAEQWQLVDIAVHSGAIARGGVRALARGWFNRVDVGEHADRRFDLRLMAFGGDPSAKHLAPPQGCHG